MIALFNFFKTNLNCQLIFNPFFNSFLIFSEKIFKSDKRNARKKLKKVFCFYLFRFLKTLVESFTRLLTVISLLPP